MDNLNLVIAGLFLLAVIYIGAQVIMKPVKLLWKLVTNSIIGLVLLLLVNYGAARFGFILPVNVITILVAGFLGIPGILLLICFQLLLQ
ncbi:MAG: pro-sigmaK processing inhibitor BofA family protein [Syntrophomonas sp.]|nr:pro-sigmaK processing inhibitor BofA family protein [Syntrophomonas sp.]